MVDFSRSRETSQICHVPVAVKSVLSQLQFKKNLYSCMMLIQCSRLGAESFINKYDSDGFMSTVKRNCKLKIETKGQPGFIQTKGFLLYSSSQIFSEKAVCFLPGLYSSDRGLLSGLLTAGKDAIAMQRTQGVQEPGFCQTFGCSVLN
ncbi:hypothetical protein AV530_002485 [Patagioenas fasciata monilis]|uniref:Uncharacterized protein n=1 Tax=Patagioenas fasciata monilis TaxID=372326 RepID=A0A1V4K6T5_PATFA|nr:hypothetical protein AV530_002485 [Patagioenas fasciata monilis]